MSYGWCFFHDKQIQEFLLPTLKHCVIHRQNLVSIKLGERLHESLNIVIKVINHIKLNALQDQLFY